MSERVYIRPRTLEVESEPLVIEQYEPIDDENEIIYKCVRCGAEIRWSELKELGLQQVKCIWCGFRILYKARPRGRKIIRAI